MNTINLRTFIILLGIVITGTWLLVYLWRNHKQKQTSQTKDSKLSETSKSGIKDLPHYQHLKKHISLGSQINDANSGRNQLLNQQSHTQTPETQTCSSQENEEKVTEIEKHDKNIQAADLVIIHLKPRQAKGFDGSLLLDIFTNRGLGFGEMNIFHRHVLSENKKRLVYSIANGKEPGHLKPEYLQTHQIDCLVIFLNLINSYNPVKAYNEMVDIAQFISQKLDGELYDAHMSVLTRQTIEHQKEKLAEVQSRRKIG